MKNITTYDENSRFDSILTFFADANEELKTKNRFSNEKLDKLVDALTNEPSNKKSISIGTIFYRARKYTEHDAIARFECPPDDIFQGYDKENSYANLTAPNEGRCNPMFIPYLYASESIPCCIHEIGAHIGDVISVAEIMTKEPLKILSLSKEFAISNYQSTILSDIPDSLVILYLESIFSRRHEKQWDYLATQYIAEKVKNNGYDGISFFSSVYSGEAKTNYTIFSLNKCEAINSKLCKVADIKIEYSFDVKKHIKPDTDYWATDDDCEIMMEEFLK